MQVLSAAILSFFFFFLNSDGARADDDGLGVERRLKRSVSSFSLPTPIFIINVSHQSVRDEWRKWNNVCNNQVTKDSEICWNSWQGTENEQDQAKGVYIYLKSHQTNSYFSLFYTHQTDRFSLLMYEYFSLNFFP